MNIFKRKNWFATDAVEFSFNFVGNKNSLPTKIFSRYSFVAAAKSAVGRRNPNKLQATYDAPSVFFYVVASVHLFFAGLIRVESMVGWAGLTSVRPVSCNAGIPTPVQLTTLECRNSRGEISSQLQEVAAWLLPLSLFARNSLICSWPFAALTFAPYLAASKSQHLLNGMPGVRLPKTLSWPSLAACPVQRRRHAHEQ